MIWIWSSLLVLLTSCGSSVCILGQGECSPSSVTVTEQKAFEVTVASSTIYSSPSNGNTFTDISFAHGTAPYAVSIPSNTTLAYFKSLTDGVTQVTSLNLSAGILRLYATSGLTAADDVVVTVTDSAAKPATKKIIVTIVP